MSEAKTFWVYFKMYYNDPTIIAISQFLKTEVTFCVSVHYNKFN